MPEIKRSKVTMNLLDVTMNLLNIVVEETNKVPSDLVEQALADMFDWYFSRHYAKYRKKLIENAQKRLIEKTRKQAKKQK